jgi:hypothetical protein
MDRNAEEGVAEGGLKAAHVTVSRGIAAVPAEHHHAREEHLALPEHLALKHQDKEEIAALPVAEGLISEENVGNVVAETGHSLRLNPRWR